MGVISAVLFLMAFVLLWALLPYLAGLREIWQQTDVAPLRIARSSEVEIRHFARGFRALITEEIAAVIEQSRTQEKGLSGVLECGETYLAVGGDNATACEPPLDDDGMCSTVLLAGDPLVLPRDMVHVGEVYSTTTIRGGAKSVFRAVLAEQDLRLERESVVLRWAHAAGELYVGTGSMLCGRASANAVIRLEEGCQFERLNAPLIVFGITRGPGEPAPDPARSEEDRRPLTPKDLPNHVEVTGNRWLVRGTLKLPRHKIIDADVVVVGGAELEDGSIVTGSIKTHKDLVIGRNVRVGGSVVAGRDLVVGEGSQIKGPVIAERDLVLDKGSVIGSPEVATTVSARTIRCRSGAQCHGTVWAHDTGEVPLPEEGTVWDQEDVPDNATKETVT